MQWYYAKNGTQLGPIAESELVAKLASHEVLPTDLVWKDGMPTWIAASSVPELASLSAFHGSRPATPPSVNSPYPYSSPSYPAAYPGHLLAPPTSGLAIASMVCGILGLVSCMLLPGIPAVICGHMALSRMSQPGVNLGGRGMAVSGLVMGYLSVLCIIGFLVAIIVAAIDR